jgi:hypothetical protein
MLKLVVGVLFLFFYYLLFFKTGKKKENSVSSRGRQLFQHPIKMILDALGRGMTIVGESIRLLPAVIRYTP